MSIQLLDSSIHVLPMRTRMPFNYGIASLTALPHVFLTIEAVIDGERCQGIASEGLPPKWFTKNPTTHFRDDLVEMLDVIASARSLGVEVGESPSVFDWWKRLYDAQHAWAGSTYPPLLWNLGVSLVERAMIDAFCKRHGKPFAEVLTSNGFAITLGDVHPELQGTVPSDWLPPAPLQHVHARHTVGLGDPLTDDDLSEQQRIHDGLPQTLCDCIRTYGLTYFKIKITGKQEADLQRLRNIAAILDQDMPGRYSFTLDGNEQFKSLDQFKAFWDEFLGDDQLAAFREHLIFVEQPYHRDVALSPELGQSMLEWNDRPPIIIDESDGDLQALPTALEYGFIGTSHKNCKGVIKGIANACLIAKRNQDSQGTTYVMSGEDLANVGPVALLQDLAVMAALGISHVERNGHHYFAGLQMYPEEIQRGVQKSHPAIYHEHPGGFVSLNVVKGTLDLSDVTAAPFGCAYPINPTVFSPLDNWSPAELDK